MFAAKFTARCLRYHLLCTRTTGSYVALPVPFIFVFKNHPIVSASTRWLAVIAGLPAGVTFALEGGNAIGSPQGSFFSCLYLLRALVRGTSNWADQC